MHTHIAATKSININAKLQQMQKHHHLLSTSQPRELSTILCISFAIWVLCTECMTTFSMVPS